MKTTFADQVKNALQRQHGLGMIARQFNRWKYLAKKSPEKYRIKRQGRKFTLEEYRWVTLLGGNDAWCWVTLEEPLCGVKKWTEEWL